MQYAVCMTDDPWLSGASPGIVRSSLTVRDALTRGTTIYMADDLWLTCSHAPAPTLRCYYCTITRGTVRPDSTGVSYAGLLASQLDCRNRCLWLINSFDCGHKVENIPLPYCLLRISQTSWKRSLEA